MIGLDYLTFRNMLLWMGAWTLIGFLVMGEDKSQAVAQREQVHKERISETTLHEVALVGGFLGIILGAKLFHHKVWKRSFWPPVALAAFIWAVLVYEALSWSF